MGAGVGLRLLSPLRRAPSLTADTVRRVLAQALPSESAQACLCDGSLTRSCSPPALQLAVSVKDIGFPAFSEFCHPRLKVERWRQADVLMVAAGRLQHNDCLPRALAWLALPRRHRQPARRVVAWVVNTVEAAERAARAGVTHVVSDAPLAVCGAK